MIQCYPINYRNYKNKKIVEQKKNYWKVLT